MPDVTIEQAMRLAMEHQRAGRLREAADIYRQILAQQPECADAYHGMGVIQGQLGDSVRAVALFRKAIALYPEQVMYRLNLGKMLAQQGEIDGAIEAYQGALKLRPDFAEVYNNLGNLYKGRGDLDEALLCYRQALDYRPAFVEVFNNLSQVYAGQGNLEEAIHLCGQALHHNPHFLIGLNNMGNYLQAVGRIDEAIEFYQQALWVRPDFADVRNDLAGALQEKGAMADAVEGFRQIVRDDAENVRAWAGLGWALMKVGRGEQGMECIRKAVALQPGNPELESLLVMMVQYREPGEVIHREASAWGRRHADPLGASADPFGKHSRDPERRLKLGLLGRELREDLLRALLTGSGGDGGRSAFHITVYCDSARREWRNHPLRQMVDRWETIAGRSDEAVAALIRGQEIDILLNLQGHGAAGGVGNGGVRSGVNRLLVVARRPAPVQVQYLANVGQGNRGSMGIAALAYRITDWVADPEGVEGAYRETLWRLPGCAWCFAAPAGAPEVGPVPSLDAEGVSRVRFGVFHSIARISPEAAEAWGRILEEVPGSRLLIKAPELGDAATWRQVESVLKESGIDVKRVELQGWMEDRGAHLSLYGEVDVALDVFPYHGTSSTFEALWMGVPVVTLGENGKAGGTGASLLTHAELGELVAGTVEEYVSIAVNLVRDRDRLRGYRATLRERLRGSPLMDGAGHARQMQEALRGMWAKFCVLSSEF